MLHDRDAAAKLTRRAGHRHRRYGPQRGMARAAAHGPAASTARLGRSEPLGARGGLRPGGREGFRVLTDDPRQARPRDSTRARRPPKLQTHTSTRSSTDLANRSHRRSPKSTRVRARRRATSLTASSRSRRPRSRTRRQLRRSPAAAQASTSTPTRERAPSATETLGRSVCLAHTHVRPASDLTGQRLGGATEPACISLARGSWPGRRWRSYRSS
jgi:hypothetical protein